MKLLDVDWPAILLELELWDALRPASRAVLLHELKLHGYVPSLRFGEHVAAIARSGIAVYEPEKHRLWVSPERHALVKVLRAMGRHQIFHETPQAESDHESRAALLHYMEDHFTGDEIQRIASSALRSKVYANRQTLAPFVAYSSWVSELIDAEGDEALLAWADTHGLSSAQFLVGEMAVLHELKELATTLLDSPDGVPLRELVDAREHAEGIALLGRAIHAGLASMALFAGMREEDLEPCIGLWPAVAREITRTPAEPPKSVEVRETFALAIQMEDMTTLLAAAAATPVRLRASDGAVFARARSEIEQRLALPPAWAADLLGENRVDAAAQALLAHRFAQVRAVAGNPHLGATSKGAQWLALSAQERLSALIEPLRRSRERNPVNVYETDRATGFFSRSLPFYQTPKSLNLRDDLTRAFLQARDVFLPVAEFLDHASRQDNPLLALADVPPGKDGALMFYSGHADLRNETRALWMDVLVHFLGDRLFALGGANIGLDDAGRLCFSLTEVGLYLLGVVERFDYDAVLAAGDVVVQPNFDVVFLGVAPAAEAELARFCERVGAAPGHVFRITRASVLAAAEAGSGVGDVIGALTRASSKPIPKNVQREIAGWMAAVRRATLRSVELIECADADIAARIVSILGASVRQIGPLVFALSAGTPASRTTMIRKLRAGGVFIDEVEAQLDHQGGARRSRDD
jgi:hypothetical protein